MCMHAYIHTHIHTYMIRSSGDFSIVARVLVVPRVGMYVRSLIAEFSIEYGSISEAN